MGGVTASCEGGFPPINGVVLNNLTGTAIVLDFYDRLGNKFLSGQTLTTGPAGFPFLCPIEAQITGPDGPWVGKTINVNTTDGNTQISINPDGSITKTPVGQVRDLNLDALTNSAGKSPWAGFWFLIIILVLLLLIQASRGM